MIKKTKTKTTCMGVTRVTAERPDLEDGAPQMNDEKGKRNSPAC